VRVVNDHVLNARFGDGAHQVRLPHALGQPHPARAHPEHVFDRRAQLVNLPDLVGVGQRGQQWLVVTAGEHLKLPARHQRPHALQQRALLGHQVIEQAAGEVNGAGDRRVALQQVQQRFVGHAHGVLVDEIELADRLVIVQHQRQINGRSHSASF